MCLPDLAARLAGDEAMAVSATRTMVHEAAFGNGKSRLEEGGTQRFALSCEPPPGNITACSQRTRRVAKYRYGCTDSK